ncbi:hypothetical protein V2647_03780 [Tenacibaculum maritimum]|uniref:hypothetical protein n=1 Tax=Tenacibaculum maritimum TaxID=107401 RepID=UPI0012E6021D|nr:hypothetical protein [Tenacibaculum maritimum]CAA0150849.1 conserved hypothetical protein [Tenacibaculum maritimum]
MISNSQKKRIKKKLGNHYVAAIKAELNDLGKLNKKGQQYSSSQITNVMNGQPHQLLEDVIFALVQKETIKQEKLKEERNAILNGTCTTTKK